MRRGRGMAQAITLITALVTTQLAAQAV